MTKQAVASDKLAPPAGPFCAAVRSNGFIFVSGQIGQDLATGEPASPCPARTAIGVAALPLGAVVEIDLVVQDTP